MSRAPLLLRRVLVLLLGAAGPGSLGIRQQQQRVSAELARSAGKSKVGFPIGDGIKVLAGITACALQPTRAWAGSKLVGRSRPRLAFQRPRQRRTMSLKDALTDSEVRYLKTVDNVPEDEILRNYDVSQLIGEGGFSNVHLAIRRHNAKHPFSTFPERLALKVLRREPESKGDTREQQGDRIAAEISYAKRFEDAGLSIYFVAVSPQAVTIAMELAGERLPIKKTFSEYTLQARMQDLVTIAHKIAWMEASGVTHCDIKVENILMTEGRGPALIDFGFTKCSGDAIPRQGTPGYMAPEAWEGRYTSDVWALGVVTYLSIFEGREPTAAENASKNRFQGPWLDTQQDSRFQTLLSRSERDAPGTDFEEKMENTQKLSWVRELLSVMEEMLRPDVASRINACQAACKLEVLAQTLPGLGAADIETMLQDAIVETEKEVGLCNKIF